ncbi:hypothetical protein CDAR_477541 [Caerostris darwini]|uniref:Uncharacterized protein n=1 Tax=Caerostris darwini TaxID=1538125 RepID=A0AAV4RT27_9ARAC|nr:hypothetical protein CDAR_477541 [Caerostris darwini]
MSRINEQYLTSGKATPEPQTAGWLWSIFFFFLPPPPHFVFWSLKRGRKSRLYAVYEDFRVPPLGFLCNPSPIPRGSPEIASRDRVSDLESLSLARQIRRLVNNSEREEISRRAETSFSSVAI